MLNIAGPRNFATDWRLDDGSWLGFSNSSKDYQIYEHDGHDAQRKD